MFFCGIFIFFFTKTDNNMYNSSDKYMTDLRMGPVDTERPARAAISDWYSDTGRSCKRLRTETGKATASSPSSWSLQRFNVASSSLRWRRRGPRAASSLRPSVVHSHRVWWCINRMKFRCDVGQYNIIMELLYMYCRVIYIILYSVNIVHIL